MTVESDGTVEDVIHDGPSYKAGIGPGMKITAVNGHQFTTENQECNRLRRNPRSEPIQLIIANGGDVQTYSVDYHGGLRYPILNAITTRPDYLSEIYSATCADD